MDGATAAQWVATALVAGGLVYTWQHNNAEKNRADTQLKADRNHADTQLKAELTMEIRSIKDKLVDPMEGLGAIKTEINSMKEHCAAVTSGCAQRFKYIEENIQKLDKGHGEGK